MTHERHKVETETETAIETKIETETVERFYQAFLNTSSVSGPTPPIETPRIFAYIRIRIRASCFVTYGNMTYETT